MSDPLEILVVILSAFLALFLVLSIVLVALLIKVLRQVARVAASAERTVDSVGSVVAGIGQVTSPALVAKYVFNLVKKYRK